MLGQFQSKQSTEANVNIDTSLWKIVVIGIFGVILAGICGYFLEMVLNGALNLMPLLIFATGFFTIFLLQVFFIKSFYIANIMVLLESVAMTVPFIAKFSLGLLIAWFLLLIFWIVVIRHGRKELDNQIKIKFLRVERSVIPHALSAFALFIAIVTVWVNGTFLTKERFQILIRPAQPILRTFLSENFSFNMTVAKFAESVLESKAGINIEALPVAAKDLAINQVLNQFRDQYKLSFRDSDTISDAVYDYTMSWLNKIPESIRIALPISAFLLVFLTVKGIAMLLRWVIVFFAYILYEVALAFGLARKSLESRSREIVTL